MTVFLYIVAELASIKLMRIIASDEDFQHIHKPYLFQTVEVSLKIGHLYPNFSELIPTYVT